MYMLRSVALLTTALAASLALIPAQAQDGYPNKPIKLLVGYAAGGGTDITARLIANELGTELGQPVIVENRPGAAGTIAANAVAKASPDGYTILFSAGSDVTITKFTVPDLPYDIFHDFAPITRVSTTPFALVTNRDLPPNSVRELIDYAKQQPKKLNMSASATYAQLTGGLFQTQSGLDITTVPYKGAAPALIDLIAGHVQFGFESVAVALPQVKGGKIKVLAVASEQRSALMPNVPTMIESGMPGFTSFIWYGMLAPKGTPEPIQKRLLAALDKVLRSSQMRQKMMESGFEPFVGDTPAAFQKFLQSETDRWIGVAQRTNYKP
jgi:tripartite-type tricarboxylate transporter receptor subunit TctC